MRAKEISTSHSLKKGQEYTFNWVFKFIFYYLCPRINITFMYNGTVKFFNESKGFGFIVEDETKNEVFVHVSGLVDEIKENDKVTYNVKEGKKGLNAIDVKVV